MREMLNYLLSQDITSKKGETANTLEVIMLSCIKKAISGDIRAAEFIRDTIGENPRFKVDNSLEIKQSTQEAFLKHLKDMGKNAD